MGLYKNNEDAKARNEFLKPNKTAKQSKRDFEKDFQIQLIQEEYRRNAIDFKSYFNKLTQQVMSPYEQDLDDDQIEALIITDDNDDKVCKLEKDSNPKLAKKEENHLAVEYPNQLFSANEIINVDDNLEIEKVNNYLEDDQWLTGRHIDLAIDYIEERAILRGFVNLTVLNNCKIEECKRNNYLLQESPEVDKIFILNVKNSHWIILTNINPTNTSSDKQWFDQ